jgi:hypothetical protein
MDFPTVPVVGTVDRPGQQLSSWCPGQSENRDSREVLMWYEFPALLSRCPGVPFVRESPARIVRPGTCDRERGVSEHVDTKGNEGRGRTV